MSGYAGHLGPPIIKLAGLRLWIHGRQFPSSQDYWDGNWLNATAHCRAQGAEVWVSGAFIHIPELARWAAACEAMNRTLSGEANLECLEPELSVTLRASSLGHISMTVMITPDHLTQEHRFEFEIDQSYLAGLIEDCHRVLADYPIRGQIGG